DGARPAREPGAFRGGAERDAPGLGRLEAVRAQPEVRDDVRTEIPHAVGGHEKTAGTIAAFEDDRLQAGLREVGSSGEAVVAAPDDDRVIGHQAAFPALSEPAT